MKSLKRFFSQVIKNFAKMIKSLLFKKISNSYLDKPFHISKSSPYVLSGLFKKRERNKVVLFMLGYVFEILGLCLLGYVFEILGLCLLRYVFGCGYMNVYFQSNTYDTFPRTFDWTNGYLNPTTNEISMTFNFVTLYLRQTQKKKSNLQRD